MERLSRLSKLVLAPIDANGRIGAALARLQPLAAIKGPALAGGPPVFAVTDLAGASGEALSRSAAAGIAGIVLVGSGGWAGMERMGARLAVAEAVAGVADGSLKMLAMATDAAAVLALAASPPPLPRLVGIGIDGEALSPGPERDVARGLALLAAASAGVPAFERVVGPGAALRLAAIRSEGFAWALVPDEPNAA